MMEPLRHSSPRQRVDARPRMGREARRPFPSIWPAGSTRYAWMAVLIAGLLLPACSHWRESFLKSGVHSVSQDDVIDRFGEPWKTKESILNGQTTWIYRYALTEDELDPMGVNSIGQGMRHATGTLGAALIGDGNNGNVDEKARPKCFHYLLTFDKAKVLARWKREACSLTSL